MAGGADVVDRRGDLAIGLLPQGAAILPLDADGMLPLLGEAGVVEDEDPFGAGEGSSQVLAIAPDEHFVVPGALVDELLEGLLGILDVQVRWESDTAGEGLDALTFAVLEQPLEINATPEGLPLMREVVAEYGGIILESVEDFRCQFRCVGLAHNDHTNNAA
jgi:hypothetical protein